MSQQPRAHHQPGGQEEARTHSAHTVSSHNDLPPSQQGGLGKMLKPPLEGWAGDGSAVEGTEGSCRRARLASENLHGGAQPLLSLAALTHTHTHTGTRRGTYVLPGKAGLHIQVFKGVREVKALASANKRELASSEPTQMSGGQGGLPVLPAAVEGRDRASSERTAW